MSITADKRKELIAITGSSGLVGSALLQHFAETHDVRRLRRLSDNSHHNAEAGCSHQAAQAGTDRGTEAGCSHQAAQAGTDGSSSQGPYDLDDLIGADVVIHLAGAPIAAKRWTAEYKEEIRRSRVESTAQLANGMAALETKPRLFICASAVGYYGNTGDETADEGSPAGTDFLARTCVEWEQAAEPARQAGIKVVNLRFAMILSRRGGALAEMLLPYRLGLGGPIGGGAQWWSWVALTDVVRAIAFVIDSEHGKGTDSEHGRGTDSEHGRGTDREHGRGTDNKPGEGVGNLHCEGAYNVVAPGICRQRDFSAALARALVRPAFIPVPAAAIRFFKGELADALILSSSKVAGHRLTEAGFTYSLPDIDGALRWALTD